MSRYTLKYRFEGECFQCVFDFPTEADLGALELARKIMGDVLPSEAEFVALDVFRSPEQSP